MWYREFYHFPKSKPRQAKGGIKAQSKRGKFGESWWAQRWIAVLESFDLGGRLSRGRSYARNGQVLSIDIEEGSVRAKVQGSRPKPYDVKIAVKTLAKAQWQAVAEALGAKRCSPPSCLRGRCRRKSKRCSTRSKSRSFRKPART